MARSRSRSRIPFSQGTVSDVMASVTEIEHGIAGPTKSVSTTAARRPSKLEQVSGMEVPVHDVVAGQVGRVDLTPDRSTFVTSAAERAS